MKNKLITLLLSLILIVNFSACSQSRARNQIIEHFKIPPEQCVLVPGEDFSWIVKDNDGNIFYVIRYGAYGGDGPAKSFEEGEKNLIFSSSKPKKEANKDENK